MKSWPGPAWGEGNAEGTDLHGPSGGDEVGVLGDRGWCGCGVVGEREWSQGGREGQLDSKGSSKVPARSEPEDLEGTVHVVSATAHPRGAGRVQTEPSSQRGHYGEWGSHFRVETPEQRPRSPSMVVNHTDGRYLSHVMTVALWPSFSTPAIAV